MNLEKPKGSNIQSLRQVRLFTKDQGDKQKYYSAGPVIGPPAHRANPVIGPSKGLHQVSAITGELRETGWGFKRREYDFGATYEKEFIVL